MSVSFRDVLVSGRPEQGASYLVVADTRLHRVYDDLERAPVPYSLRATTDLSFRLSDAFGWQQCLRGVSRSVRSRVIAAVLRGDDRE